MKHASIIFTVGLALTTALSAAPAYALSGRTFVSPTGSDSNPCSLALPCRNLQAALAQTNPGGEIAILGTAGYNGGATVIIDKAISIVNPGAYEAGISVASGGTGIVINAGVNDVISLRGLTIDGGGVGVSGITFTNGKSLTVDDCVIRHFYLGNGVAIIFQPVAASILTVTNSKLYNNFDGTIVAPSGSAPVTAVFSHVEANNNNNAGFEVDGYLSTGTLKVTVSDSVAAGNNAGIQAYSDTGHAPTAVMVVRSVSAYNNYGLSAGGVNGTIRVANSTVTGNQIGWQAISSGVLQSYGNNSIDGNTSNEAAPPSVALK